MAENDLGTGPSLKLPSLWRRRRRRGSQPDAPRHARPGTEPAGGQVDTAERVIEPSTAHTPALTPTAVPTPAPPAQPAGPAQHRASASRRSVPDLAGSTAALLVGALVGLAGCALTFLGLRGCELVTGTDSCGGPGLLVLGVILVAMVLIGAVVLRALRVSRAAGTSFLGVGMMTVVALLFFTRYVDEPWLFVVVPVVAAASFGIARWITTRYAGDVLPDDDEGPRSDVR